MSGFPTVAYSPERLSSEMAEKRGRHFLQIMSERRSVRQFSAEAVPMEMIQKAVATAGTAPSGANLQPWTFVVVGNSKIKREIRLAAEKEERQNYAGRMSESWLADLEHLGTNADKGMLETAPWLVVVFRQNTRPSGQHNYYVQESVGLATGLLLASLRMQGLATLTHTPSPLQFLAEILNRPKNERPYLLIPVGWPAAECRVPDIQRKELKDILVVHC